MRGQAQAPSSQTRAKRGLRSSREPPLIQELPLHGPIVRIRNLSYVVESRRGRSSGRNLGAVAFEMKNPREREDGQEPLAGLISCEGSSSLPHGKTL